MTVHQVVSEESKRGVWHPSLIIDVPDVVYDERAILGLVDHLLPFVINYPGLLLDVELLSPGAAPDATSVNDDLLILMCR
jgi:hypothetical protein